MNESGLDFEVDQYEILSPGGSLAAGGWSSMQDQNLPDFPAGQGVGDGWEELGSADATFVGEAYLQGTSTFADGGAVELGSLYSTATDAQDLLFTYRLADGVIVEGVVDYVPITGVFANADFDEDGAVDAVDLGIWEAGFGAVDAAKADGDANGDGVVDGSDFLRWQRAYSPAAGVSAVPEPASVALWAIGLAVAMTWSMPARRRVRSAAAICLILLATSTAALAGSTNDRFYSMGDNPDEGAAIGAEVNQTFDSVGEPLAGNFQDLEGFFAPVYVDVSDRPLAGDSEVGIEFDGAGAFLEGTRLGLPSTSEPAVPGEDGLIPEDYTGIANRGFQLWVQPAVADAAQSIVLDTNQHGLRISADGTWSMRYDGSDFDSDLAVTP
ncbi:MAG: hypothetical protein AAF961_18390, partial [Planctomycetota bacterium]